MKKATILKQVLLMPVVFCWYFFTANAQITVTSGDFNKVASGINQKVDTLPLSSVTPGSAGTNQTYDFSALHSHVSSTSSMISPSSGVKGSSFSMANACMHQDTMYFYFDTTSSYLNLWGVAGNLLQNGVNNAFVYSNPQKVITFPSTYNTTFTDTAEYDNVLPYNGYYYGIYVDSVREKETIITVSLIDGWGTVATPNETFNCLRQNIVKHSVDSTWAKVVVGSTHYWLNVSSDTSSTQSYSYISNEGGGPIVDIEYYTSNNFIFHI